MLIRMVLKRDEKPVVVEELKTLLGNYRTVGILNMSKMPARQFLRIKNMISKDGVKIKMMRKGLIMRALNESGVNGVNGLVDRISDSPALLFSNSDPFKLFSLLKKNRATSAAKVGSVVTKDIIIPKGSIGIPPGPAITTLGKIGLKTRVEGGKIAVINDKTVLKAGESVTADFAAVFSLLKIEPIEIGLRLVAAWENGMIYGSDVLDVSVDQYLRDVESAVRAATNLSLNTGYITTQTASLAIQLAFWHAKSLCLAANILEKDVIGELLAKAVAEAEALEEKIPATEPTPLQS